MNTSTHKGRQIEWSREKERYHGRFGTTSRVRHIASIDGKIVFSGTCSKWLAVKSVQRLIDSEEAAE